MTLTIDIPDDLAAQVSLTQTDGARQLFEDFLLQRYAEGKLSFDELAKALGFDAVNTETFLRAHRQASRKSDLQKDASAPPPMPDFLERAKRIWGDNPTGTPLSQIVSENRD